MSSPEPSSSAVADLRHARLVDLDAAGAVTWQARLTRDRSGIGADAGRDLVGPFHLIRDTSLSQGWCGARLDRYFRRRTRHTASASVLPTTAEGVEVKVCDTCLRAAATDTPRPWRR